MLRNILQGGVYVIHAKHGYEFHEQHIISLFKKQNIEFEFASEADTALFTQEYKEQFFTSEMLRLPNSLLSCTLNHIFACKRMLANGDEYALIFEDDIFFTGNFTGNFKKLMPEISALPKGFIVSLEDTTLTYPSVWQTKKNKHLYKAKVGRMAGAYVIDKKAAEVIMQEVEINKCPQVIDWWHSILATNNQISIYWAHPSLAEQGSHNGKMSSTNSTKKTSTKQQISWKLKKLFRSTISRLFIQNRLV